MRDDVSGHEDRLLGSWLELREALAADPEKRRELFDPVTGLPTVPLVFPRIDALLQDRGEVSLLCVDLVHPTEAGDVEMRAFGDVVRAAGSALASLGGTCLRDADIVAELTISGSTFVVVLAPPRDSRHADPEALRKLTARVEAHVRERLTATHADARWELFAGVATQPAVEEARLEALVRDCIDAALVQAMEGRAEAAG